MRISTLRLGPALLCALCVCGGASAATFKTIYAFCPTSDCEDGVAPLGPVIADDAGNLYGTTNLGGEHGNGVVFELVADAARAHWTEKTLYDFCIGSPYCIDGARPHGGLIRDVKGNLYGVTQFGGAGNRGVVFELASKRGGAEWDYRRLYSFCTGACTDGEIPGSTLTYAGAESGALYDGSSTLYGVTGGGGLSGDGVAYELRRQHGQWLQDVIFDFSAVGAEGPSGPILFDEGVIYGLTALEGPNGGGTFYQLAETALHKWNYTQLYAFGSLAGPDAGFPVGGLVRDAGGQFYGASAFGGKNDAGTLFSLTVTDGVASERVLSSFCYIQNCHRGASPASGVLIAADGTLFGTTTGGGDGRFFKGGAGTVYSVRDGKVEVVYTFCEDQGCSDGAAPVALAMDDQGNLFGVTSQGGQASSGGTVFEITP